MQLKCINGPRIAGVNYFAAVHRTGCACCKKKCKSCCMRDPGWLVQNPLLQLWCTSWCALVHQLVRSPLLQPVVKSFKAWQLLVTRLRNTVACRGMVVESKEDVFDFEHLVALEPFAQFEAWFDEATKHEKVTTEDFVRIQ